MNSPMQWQALYTKGRHEKALDKSLREQGFEAFLPLNHIKRRWSDRTVTVEEPVFSSYLFVKSNPLMNATILRQKGAVKFVSAAGQPVPVSDSVIEVLKNIFSTQVPVDPFPYLHTGERVCVRSGVFKGVEGIIVRKDDGRCRVVVSVDAIRSSISFEVDSCLVEKV